MALLKIANYPPQFRQFEPAQEKLVTDPALVVDHLVLGTATEEAEIDHLRQTLNLRHYLMAARSAGHVLWQGIFRTDTDCPELS